MAPFHKRTKHEFAENAENVNFVLHSELFHVIPHGSGRASAYITLHACNVMPARSPATTALQGGASGQAVWLG